MRSWDFSFQLQSAPLSWPLTSDLTQKLCGYWEVGLCQTMEVFWGDLWATQLSNYLRWVWAHVRWPLSFIVTFCNWSCWATTTVRQHVHHWPVICKHVSLELPAELLVMWRSHQFSRRKKQIPNLQFSSLCFSKLNK